MKTQVQEQEQEHSQALAVKELNAVANVIPQNDLDFRFMAELSAEIDAAVKSVAVDKLTSPTDLLGQRLTLNDCFLSSFDFGKGETENVVYAFTNEANELIFSSQSTNVNRMKFVNLFDSVRRRNAALREAGQQEQAFCVTNVIFEKLERGGVGVNKPIILAFTKDTKTLWS